MKLIRNTKTIENRNFWESIEKVSQEVSAWPGWMKGESLTAKNTINRKMPAHVVHAHKKGV